MDSGGQGAISTRESVGSHLGDICQRPTHQQASVYITVHPPRAKSRAGGLGTQRGGRHTSHPPQGSSRGRGRSESIITRRWGLCAALGGSSGPNIPAKEEELFLQADPGGFDGRLAFWSHPTHPYFSTKDVE